MSTTLANVLTRLAYRLGEDSSPTNSNVKARRVNAIGEGYTKVILDTYWWWTEASDTLSTVASQQSYGTADGLPTDLRDIIEVRIDNYVYTNIPQSKVFGLYDSNQAIFNYDSVVADKHWYFFENKLYILPTPESNGSNNIALKYFKYPTIPSADDDTFLIPDLFTRCLDAYAYAKIKSLEGLRGDAADGINEFNEVLSDMRFEHNRRLFAGKSVRPVHPSYLVE